MYRIGLDIGGTGIQMGIVDEKGHIRERGEVVTNTSLPFSEQVRQMAECALDMVKKGGYSLLDIASIGAGVPGVADQKTGAVIYCTNLGWKHVPFREEFRKYIDKPVFVDNADPSDFHEVADHGRTLSDQCVVRNAAYLDNIICDQHMTAFDQFQRGLAFAYAGFSSDENTNTVYIHQYSMPGYAWSQGVGQVLHAVK